MPTVTELRGSVSLDPTPYEQGLSRIEKTTEETTRQALAEWRWLGQETIKSAQAAERAQVAAARQAAREQAQAARQAAQATKQAERESSEAAKQAAREREQAAREAVREQMRLARDLERAEREAARNIAQAHREAQREATAAARQAAREQQQAMTTARQNFGAAFGGAGTALTLGVTAPVLFGGVKAIEEASAINEAMSKSKVVFGDAARSVQDFAKSAASIGQSERMALAATGAFGALFHVVGLSGAEAATMSVRLDVLASDLASMHDIKPEEALEKLRSGLVGESEPLRTVGILLTENRVKQEAYRMGIAAVGAELTESQKVQARYSLILKDGALANGDFARTSGDFANSLRQLQAEISNEAAAFGKELLPVAKDALKTGRELLHAWNELPEPIKRIGLEATIAAAAIGPLIKVVEGLVIAGKGLAAIPTLIGGIGGGAAGAIGAGEVAAGGAGAAGIGGTAVGASPLLPVAAGVGVSAALAVGATQGLRPGSLEWLAAIANRASEVATGGPGAIAWNLWNDWNNSKSRGLRGTPNPAVIGPSATPAPTTATPLPEDAIPADPRKLAKAAAQTFEAQMDRARAAALQAPEERQAQEEAARLIPILTARQAELRQQGEQTAETDKALAAIDLQIAQLKRDSEREKTANAKRAAEAEKRAHQEIRQAQAAYYDALTNQAKASAEGAPEDQRAQAEATATIPVLTQRYQALASEAAALLPQTQSSMDARTRYLEIEKEGAELQQKAAALQRRAADEVKGNQEKAQREQSQALKDWADAQIYAAEQAKRLADEQKRATEEAARKAQETARDARQLANLRTTLLETQLKNWQMAFGTSDREGLRTILPSLIAEFRAAMRPVKGETEADRLQREIAGGQIGQKILETAGKAGMNRRQVFAELGGLANAESMGLERDRFHLTDSDIALAKRAGFSERGFTRDIAGLLRSTDALVPNTLRPQVAAQNPQALPPINLRVEGVPPDLEQLLQSPRGRAAFQRAVADLLNEWNRQRR